MNENSAAVACSSKLAARPVSQASCNGERPIYGRVASGEYLKCRTLAAGIVTVRVAVGPFVVARYCQLAGSEVPETLHVAQGVSKTSPRRTSITGHAADWEDGADQATRAIRGLSTFERPVYAVLFTHREPA